jgi:hypothetical protein
MEAPRRDFVRTLTLGIGVTFASAGRAWAQRPRILGEQGGGGPAVVVGRVSPDTAAFLKTVRVGATQTQGSLSVLWLSGQASGSAVNIVTLEEARGAGTLVITEREQAAVPTLVVENRGATHALLLAGEILLGGKQNRVLTEDLLLPPGSGPKEVTVYCVEQGRWSGARVGFEARGSFAAPGLRSQVLARPGQARVWAEVDRYSRQAAAPSPTRSYQQVFEQPEVKAHVKSVEEQPDLRAAPGALGAAVFVGMDLGGIDAFRTPELFAREWPKLLRAYAVETYGRPPAGEGDSRRLRDRVEELLQAGTRAEGTVRTSVGVGQLFEYRAGDRRAAALVFGGSVVHVAIL